MTWKVVVGAEDGAWPDDAQIPMDATDWAEAWDDIIPGYKAARFADEKEANAAARRLRAFGFISATEPEVVAGAGS